MRADDQNTWSGFINIVHVADSKKEGVGIEVEGKYCGILLFADDTVMIAESEEELERMLSVVAGYARRCWFRFNDKKSKVVVVGGVQRRVV